MNSAIALSETPALSRRRGRWQLLLLLAIVIGPMFLASAMYHWRFWVPESRSYHGELIGNGQTRADLGVVAGEGTRWQLLVTAPSDCDADCRQLVFLARQIHIGLNRDASRASHALASTRPLSADYEAELQRGYPQLARFQLELEAYGRIAGETSAANLWIVDPLGNLVLRYDASSKGKGVLDDLRYLLKISQID